MDCPNIASCPFPELKAKKSEECGKVLYCDEDSFNGFENCARYKYKNQFGVKPLKHLLPSSWFLK